MSKESSASRLVARNVSKNGQPEANENQFETSLNALHFPPPRTPLNAIADPAQYREEFHEYFFYAIDKAESARVGRPSDRRFEVSDKIGNACASIGSPRSSGHGWKSHSEPNSAQSTPARSYSRPSLTGAILACHGSRASQYAGGKGGSYSRASRGISNPKSEYLVEVMHFELEEDPSFWTDHSVQVLIRIRPLSNMERVSQGYGRCLRQESAQTVAWLGHPETRFTFDHVACETISQQCLFKVAGLPMVENCMSGYNSCMFAYGQTGSGKTYTMMGEILEGEGKLYEDCGLTPRIFEYLFTRIRAEEDSRRDEKLKYSCKCSFLEIYNEQITDLLEPSFTNLQLREDLKKGVYVENLTEYVVTTVNDVVKLLLQGAANRKNSATRMNSESSRSHSVFTCIIESCWEKDSMSHFRFARLNLVDLAGSERQKSSGAEGDRLKEAANINKSLSTLGLVIMSLVDLAHGKHRHIPYRDSRLTFLLQDSLGGNSKTTIIANVSPSICSANETLSTLKFAQRAKLIQNNAKVNEDASGEITALQQQIQQLKGQLSILMKHNNLSKTFSSSVPAFKETISCLSEEYGSLGITKANDNNKAFHHEEEIQSTRMILKLRDEKIKKLELLLEGTLSADKYLMEENKALLKEIQLLQSRIDRNPELTIVTSENVKLLEQHQLFQNFHERGEREALLGEVKELHNQLREAQNGSYRYPGRNEYQSIKYSEDVDNTGLQIKLKKATKELEEVRIRNAQYEEDQALDLSQPQRIEIVRQQVEIETTRTILHLQEEIGELQLELHQRLFGITQENTRLKHALSAKEEEVRALCDEWETATLELTCFLADGSRSIRDAYGQIEGIARSFPKANILLNEHVEKAARVSLEKEEKILLLQKSLEDAQKMLVEMNLKLDSLKGATMALNEVHEVSNFESTEDAYRLSTLVNEENIVQILGSKLKFMENELAEAEKRADAAFLVVKWLSDRPNVPHFNSVKRDISIPNLDVLSNICCHNVSDMKVNANSQALEEANAKFDLISFGVLELGSVIDSYYADTEKHVLTFHTTIHDLSSEYKELVHDLVREIQVMRTKVKAINENPKSSQACADQLLLTDNLSKLEQNNILHQIREELFKINDGLNGLKYRIASNEGMEGDHFLEENLVEADVWSSDCSSSSSFSTESVAPRRRQTEYSYSPCKNSKDGSVSDSEDLGLRKSKKLLDSLIRYKEASCLRKELDKTFDSFCELYNQLAALLNGHEIIDASLSEELGQTKSSLELTMEKAEASGDNSKVVPDEKIWHDTDFLTRFKESHATIKEADEMLNALLNAYENAKQMNGMWKQAGEQLLLERASLLKEVEQLRFSMHQKERENELQRNRFQLNLEEMSNAVSLLEGCFSQMQKEVEERFSTIFSDVYSMGNKMLKFLSNFRSPLEDICSEIIGKEFAFFVLNQCYAGESIRIFPRFNPELDSHLLKEQESRKAVNDLQSIFLASKDVKKHKEEGIGGDLKTNFEEDCLSHDDTMYENLELKKELQRKEDLLEGLLFDFRLLQESASERKDIKDKTEKLIFSLSHVCQELEIKTSQLDNMLVEQRKLKALLVDAEKSLLLTNSDLEEAKAMIDSFVEENEELRMLLKDHHIRKREAARQLEEQKEIVKGLENEILHLTSLEENKMVLSVEDIENDLRSVSCERDQLYEEIHFLSDKLKLAHALVDEKEAVSFEARQESKASKLYAEQKEEEVKILERSVEELECTINVLERKVYEMNEEVERNHTIRDSLELELQALRERLLAVEQFTEAGDSQIPNSYGQTSRFRNLQSEALELFEANTQIKLLEKERAEQDEEIKQCRNYISELVVLAEAQTSQYQQKFMNLEAMVREVKTDLPNPALSESTTDKAENNSVRTRGSGSPFRCIAGLRHQMNLEKEHELSIARLRIEELEGLVASRQKEACILNTRLAAAESMTHDVIRDLLGVKLDMTKYANLIEHYQVQKIVEESHLQTEDFRAKEQELLSLRTQINDLVAERDSCESILIKKEGEVLAFQMTLEKLRERDQLLSAQNEMLKMDNTNLKKRIAELDEMGKTHLGMPSNPRQIHQIMKSKENEYTRRTEDGDLMRRLAQSRKILSQVNDEIAQYHECSVSHPKYRNGHNNTGT